MTYYYAEIDENNICVAVTTSPVESTAENMILIAVADDTPDGFWELGGKQYNPSTGEWSDPVYYYYVKVDADGIVVDTQQSLTQLNETGYTQVDSLDGIWTGCVLYNGQYMEMQKAMYLMQKNATVIKSVQRGVITIEANAYSGTKTIEAVDPEKAFVVFGGFNSYQPTSANDIPSLNTTRLDLTNATTVTARRATVPNETAQQYKITVPFQVVEFN